MCCPMCTSVPSGRRVHLFLDSKMYTSGSIANSQRILTEMVGNKQHSPKEHTHSC